MSKKNIAIRDLQIRVEELERVRKATYDVMEVQVDYFFALLNHLGLKITHVNEHDIVEKRDENE